MNIGVYGPFIVVAEAKATVLQQQQQLYSLEDLNLFFLHSSLLRLPPLSSPKVNLRKKLKLLFFNMSPIDIIDPTVAVF